MKKIGIITLNGYDNYGNRLQNYALQEVLKSFNYNVETIIIELKSNENRTNIVNKIRDLSFIEILKAICFRTIYRTNYTNTKIRRSIFSDFSSKHIKEIKYYINDVKQLNDVCEFSYDYEYFIVGSDQVWNPNFIDNMNLYFLQFADKYKRIAYAASFGISNLPSEKRNIYKTLLQDMEHISVREYDGSKIINELINIDVPVLLDPTLLLTSDSWLRLSKEIENKPKRKYLLTYFLGNISSDYKKQIKRIAELDDLVIIKLNNIKDKETYRTGPSEFLYYIYNCSILCTDSFHGVAFSILFEKPFIIFPRDGTVAMYSRINTILDKFKLNSRKIENIDINNNVFHIDYIHVPSILENERIKAFDFLKNALKIYDNETI